MATPGDAVHHGKSSHLVDDFESAFQNCISLLTSQEHFNVQDSEETKGSVENSVQRFLESARDMETFFLNKRLILSVAKPEHVLNEDISELRQELDRKDKLIEKHHEKLSKWQALLRSNPPPPSTTPSSPFSGSQAPGLQAMPSGSTTMSQPGGGLQGSGPHFAPNMMGQPGGNMAPGQYPGPPLSHPGQYMPPPAYHQGPLSHLERI